MATDLAVLESQLQPLVPQFEQVLAGRMPVERLTRTVLVSAERTPKLLQCNRQSLFNAAMSAAVLGLEVDGVTGQAFLIPFKDRAQLVIGYKGHTTLAARSGYTVAGAVVREGDSFEYELGTNPLVRHRPSFRGGRITHAYATATSKTLPPIVSVLGIDDILAVKAKSPGARKPDSPWNDPEIGFPAMAEKTAKRRLARSMPLNILQLAARLEEAYDEQGKHSWIDPERGVQIEGEAPELVAPSTTPTMAEILPPHGFANEPVVEPAADAGTLQSAAGTLSTEDMAREAASRGQDVFDVYWKKLSGDERDKLRPIGPELRRLINEAAQQEASP